MNIKTITFLGMGLIGGSIAKAIQKNYKDIEIKLQSRSLDTIKKANQLGLCKNEDFLPIEELANSDLIFLCAPLGANTDFLKEIKPYIKGDTLITDVGSVKSDIHSCIRELELEKHFVGAHPMAGSEKSGIEYSDINLLVGARYVLTSEDGSTNSNIEILKEFLEPFGSKFVVMSYRRHDLVVGTISHLPHVLSAAIVHTVISLEKDGDNFTEISAGGFRDMTRIAASSPEMWQHICLANSEGIIDLIEAYEKELSKIKGYIRDGKAEEIYDYFNKSKEFKEER